MPPTLLQSTCFNGLMMNLNIAGSRVVRGMEGFFFFDFFIRRNNITRDFYVREYIFGITVYNIVSFAASYPVLGLVKIIFFLLRTLSCLQDGNSGILLKFIRDRLPSLGLVRFKFSYPESLLKRNGQNFCCFFSLIILIHFENGNLVPVITKPTGNNETVIFSSKSPEKKKKIPRKSTKTIQFFYQKYRKLVFGGEDWYQGIKSILGHYTTYLMINFFFLFCLFVCFTFF